MISSLYMLYHYLTLSLLSFFLHLSPLISFIPLSLCSFYNIISTCLSLCSFHNIISNLFSISNFFHFIFRHSILCIYAYVFTWRLWAVDWLRKSLCSLWLLSSASILSKNNEINQLIPIFFIFYYCLINLKIIRADSRKRFKNLEVTNYI